MSANKTDIMAALAAARPAGLDVPAPSAERRYDDLERALSHAVEQRPARRHGRRLLAGVGGVVAVGVAAAVAITMTSPGGTSSGHRVTRSPEPVVLDARTILLTAANKAAGAPVGRYWRSHTINGQAYHVGPSNGGYVITGARMEVDEWLSPNPKVSDVFFSRFAAAVPQTPADTAAWKAGGSPTSWRVLSNGQMIDQSGRPEAWDRRSTSPEEKQSMLRHGSSGLLVTDGPDPDPRQVAKQILDMAAKFSPGQRPSAAQLIRSACTELAGPRSNKFRAAIFRFLAAQPGIRTAGIVTDLEGRKAIALSARDTGYGSVPVDTELLLDPSTYAFLGDQDVLVGGGTPETAGMRPGTVYRSEIMVDSGWTDQAPHHP